jgi:NAD(P)-dependent dehydrogenase (short-subunit alcohol dehydrogenase family)
VVADISGAEEQVAAEIGGIAFHGDVSDPDDAQAMVTLAEGRHGALHASGGGSIVATASAAGVVAAPQLAAYGAAKSAVIGLTRTAAVECASLGVRVNCICPGVVNTPITRRAPEEVYDAFVRAHPIGRLAEPEAIAAAALFLASDDASFVTGAALCVDGGFTVA